MKKCPKCGTILDDSKVKCYVCGTDLQRQTLTNGNSFNESIGATVSNNQGNVLSNNRAFQETNMNQINGSFSSGSSFSNSLYNNQLNNLNSMAYDDRTALEKMFSSDDRFKSKSEINAENAMRNNMKRNSFVDAFNNSMNTDAFKKNTNPPMNNQMRMPNNNVGNQMNVPNNINNVGMNNQMIGQNNMNQQMNNQMQPQLFTQQMMKNKNMQQQQKSGGLKDKILGKFKDLKSKKNVNKQPNNTQINPQMNNGNGMPNNNIGNLMNPQNNSINNQINIQPVQNNQNNQKNEKPPINWGNNLVNDNNKEDFKKGFSFNVNPSLIFNIVALVISIAGVLFVYMKFIKHDDNGRIESLNGLRYSIADNFKLKDEKNNYRFYAYGDRCSISITSGSTNAVATFIDDMYEEIKKNYDGQNYKVSKNEAKYNDNVWTEMNVVYIADNAASASGYNAQTKIQFVAIINEGKYFRISYENIDSDNICTAGYEGFLKTLAFK